MRRDRAVEVLSLERRTEPGESADDFERECRALVDGIEGAEVRMGLVRPPFGVDPGGAMGKAALTTDNVAFDSPGVTPTFPYLAPPNL